MATPRPYHTYEREYALILSQIKIRELPILFPSRAEAIRARRHFYAFKSAAIADIESSREIGLLVPLVRTRISGTTLTFSFPPHLLKGTSTNESDNKEQLTLSLQTRLERD